MKPITWGIADYLTLLVIVLIIVVPIFRYTQVFVIPFILERWLKTDAPVQPRSNQRRSVQVPPANRSRGLRKIRQLSKEPKSRMIGSQDL